MAEISKLFVTLSASTKDFQKSMDGVQKNLQNVGKGISDAGKGMTKWVTGPITAVGTGLFVVAKKTADAGDAIQKMALRTGLSTEALSELKFAAELSGASIDTVEKAVKKMQKGLLDAERGMETSERALSELGLKFEDLQGLSPEDQFNTLSKAIAGIEDPSKRAALAQEVFGRAGTELLPMLSAGADGIEDMRQEARDMGIVFDQEAADAAAKFNDDLARLQGSLAGVFQELATQLMPILIDSLIPAIQNNVIPLIRSFAERIGELVTWFKNLSPETKKMIGISIGIAAAIGPVLIVVGKLISLFSAIIPIIKVVGVVIAALTSPIGLIVLAIAGLIAIFVWLFQTNEEFRDGVLEIWEGIKSFLMPLWELIKESAMEIWGSIQEIISIAMELIQEVITVVLEIVQAFWEEWGDTILTASETTFNNIKIIIETVINVIKNLIGLSLDIIRGDWSGAWEKIKNITSSITKGIKDIIKNTLSGLNSIFKNIFDGILSFITGLGSKFFNAGKELIDQMAQGIKNAASKAIEAIKDIAGKVRDFLPFSPAKIGPLSDLDKLDFGGPITASIQADTTDVQRSMSQLLQPHDISRNTTSDTPTSVSFERMFAGANISVRSDDDIRRLSREVGNITISKLRGAGVL